MDPPTQEPEITVLADDVTWHVRVRGAVESQPWLQRLEEALDEAIAWSPGNVVLDLTGGVDLSQEAINAILEARRVLSQRNRQLVVRPEGVDA